MSKYKHLLFDVDGTLVDTYFANLDSFLALMDKHYPGHGKGEKDFDEIFGIPGYQGLQAMGVAEEKVKPMLYEWVELLIERSHTFKLYPEVLSVLSFLKNQGYQMAVVTSRTRDANMGGPLGDYLPEPVRPYITRAVCAGDTPRPKPYPDPILHYMEQTGAKREEILFIGDAPTDLQAANAAGVDFALALWGYRGHQHLYCKHYARSLWDIVAICSAKDEVTEASHGQQALSVTLHRWARELNALGQIGLTYAKDRFDIERYQRLQEMACEISATYVDDSIEHIKQQWCTQVGYRTPQVDTRAAIFDNQGRILMVQEKTSGLWNLPGGWCDENQTLVSNTVKEVREEACMDVHVTKLIAVLDRNRHNSVDSLSGVLKAFLECARGPGTFVENNETAQCRFFAEDEIPVESLRTTTNSLDQIKMCFAAHRSENWVTVVE